MQQGANDFVSINILLADILRFCNDEDLRSGYTKGFYISSIQSALEALAYDTFFLQLVIDVPMDNHKLQVEIPNNIFNIRELYLWSGECCGPTNSVAVHYKRLFNNMNSGGIGYSSRIKGGGTTSDPIYPVHYNTDPIHTIDNNHPSDPLYPRHYNGFGGSSLRWANIQNGILMFSSGCGGYQNVRIVANGTAGAIGDAPIIPRYFREAIIDYVCEQYFRVQMAKDPRIFAPMQQMYELRLNGKRGNGTDGSWCTAENRVKTMDSWERDELIEYMSKKW